MTSTSSGTVLTGDSETALVVETLPSGPPSPAEHGATMGGPLGRPTGPESGPTSPESPPLQTKQTKPMSSSSSSRDDVKEVDPRDRRLLTVACLQLILGAMTIIWGCAAVSHDAALAGASAAAAFIAGLTGLAAGTAGLCARHSRRKGRSAQMSATANVALSAVALAACSLVMALAATGLLRDANQSAQQVSWAALLSNTGLVLSAGLLAVAGVASFALWRRHAGICSSRGGQATTAQAQPGEPLPGTPPHKHRLVSKWLGQQQQQPLFFVSTLPSRRGGSVYSAGSAPHIIPLHVPPPPFLQPLGTPLGPLTMGPLGPHMGPPPCMLHGHAMTLPNQRERRRSRGSRGARDRRMSAACLPCEEPEVPELEGELIAPGARAERRQRAPTALTEQDMERSYTGLDRAMAEDFITQVMEKQRPHEEVEHHMDEEEARPNRRVSTASSAHLSLSRHDVEHF